MYLLVLNVSSKRVFLSLKAAVPATPHCLSVCPQWFLYRTTNILLRSVLFVVLLVAFSNFAKGDCWLRHVCPSVRTEQLVSHWTDVTKILYLHIFPKSVYNTPVPLQPDNNDGTSHTDRYTRSIISRSVAQYGVHWSLHCTVAWLWTIIKIL